MNRKTLCALLLSGIFCGCASMDNLRGTHASPRVYGGVRQDVKQAAQSTRDVFRAKTATDFTAALGSGTLSVIDAPFSAVADTVTLPATVGAAVRR